MEIDPAALKPSDMYRLMVGAITPRPIAWVSTLSADGKPNLAPFSFFNGVCAHPPTLAIAPVNRRDGSRKDTVANIEATGEFTVNAVPFALAEAMNLTSAEVDPDTDEFVLAGLTGLPAAKVKPARVSGSPVQWECVLDRMVAVGEGPLAAHLILGRIVWVHVDEAILDGQGKVDAAKLDAIGRMGGEEYCRTLERFALPRPRLPMPG